MTGWNYTPGQLAVVTVRGRQHNAVRDSTGAWLIGDVDDLRVLADVDELVTAVQLLPTLDPRAQATLTRFREVLGDEGVKTTNRAISQALIALTPRPPEPLGFGAVVVDVDGKRWLRDETDPAGPWVFRDEVSVQRATYDEISVLEVRSLGDVA